MLIASWGSRVLMRQLSTLTNPVFLDGSIDGRLLVFTIGITIWPKHDRGRFQQREMLRHSLPKHALKHSFSLSPN
jgi:hypothetical protein